MINLTINGKSISVPKGTTVYKAAKQLGIDIPIFCYQDRMPPFGACRMCLVEVEKMGKLQASCTLEASEGMVVKTESPTAVEGRQSIIELLLINHPLDCPICDRGGECPLQDNSYANGTGVSRFVEDKRHFKKALPLGPVLMLDRERCIVCARCTRFGDLIAGDHALEFIDRGFKTEVGTPDGKPVESKFIGNTIQICPVGALTSQVYRFRARPWDNYPTNSTCTLCPVGCSMILDSRDGEIMRTRAQENPKVNDIWLCDKGWFGYEFTSHPDRLQTPLIRRSGQLEPATWEEALWAITKKIKEVKPRGKLAALGGNPLTVEENFLFQKLMREGAGVNHLDHRIGMPILSLTEEGLPPGMEMPIAQCEELSFALLLGLDLTEEFPVIWLRLRQALNRGATVNFIGHFAPEIAKHLTTTLLHAPGKELEILKEQLPKIADLASKGKGAIFLGRQYLASPYRKQILSELMKLRKSHPNLSLNLMEGRGNSIGARFAGMRPDLAPLGRRLVAPGLNAHQLLATTAKSGWDFLYVAGADPASKFPAKQWAEMRSKLGFLVVQDLFLTETAQQADIVLPTLSYIEKGGTFISIEGRVQTLQPGKETPENLYSDAEIFCQLAHKLDLSFSIDEAFLQQLKLERIALVHPEGFDNDKPAVSEEERADALYATFAHALFDHGVRMQHNAHVIELVKDPCVRLHPSDGAKRSIKDGDKVSLRASGNVVNAKAKLDERVAKGAVVLPLGFPEVPVQELSGNLVNGFPVEVMRLKGA